MRWIVDGMNVIGSRPDGWWRDRHAAMVRLVQDLERFSLDVGQAVTVVYEHPPARPIASELVEVGHASAPARDSADGEIVRRVLTDPDPASLSVVTSDRRLVAQVTEAGAMTVAAGRFRRRLDDLA